MLASLVTAAPVKQAQDLSAGKLTSHLDLRLTVFCWRMTTSTFWKKFLKRVSLAFISSAACWPYCIGLSHGDRANMSRSCRPVKSEVKASLQTTHTYQPGPCLTVSQTSSVASAAAVTGTGRTALRIPCDRQTALGESHGKRWGLVCVSDHV